MPAKAKDTNSTTDVPRETDEQRLARITEEVNAEVPEDRPEDAALATAIESASTELEEKADVLKRIQDSRELTSLLVGKGIGSREQVIWTRFYLPRKLRGSGSNGE